VLFFGLVWEILLHPSRYEKRGHNADV